MAMWIVKYEEAEVDRLAAILKTNIGPMIFRDRGKRT